MKRYIAKALRGAAERGGRSVKAVKRKFASLDAEQRRQYAEASKARAFGAANAQRGDDDR